MTRYSINRKLGREKMDERAVNVVGVGGSMAETSRSAGALKIVLEGAEEAGADTAASEIANLDQPMYAPGDAAPPESALVWLTRFTWPTESCGAARCITER